MAGMESLNLAKELQLALLAEHAICLEHLALLSAAPA
jgi:hypothetical protein